MGHGRSRESSDGLMVGFRMVGTVVVPPCPLRGSLVSRSFVEDGRGPSQDGSGKGEVTLHDLNLSFHEGGFRNGP